MHTAHGVQTGVQARLTDGNFGSNSVYELASIKNALAAWLHHWAPHPGMDGLDWIGLDVAFAPTIPCLEEICI